MNFSQTPSAYDWQALYRQVILESDVNRTHVLMEMAYKAIWQRALELWYRGAEEPLERHELDTALCVLDVLRKVRPVQEPVPRIRDPDLTLSGRTFRPPHLGVES